MWLLISKKEMPNKPKVSVIMPVYNGEKYVRAAIDSILAQTFTDFELLIIDDGSNDKSIKIIKSYSDRRIRIIRNDKNRGLPYTRNEAIESSLGEYIANLDCDDISHLSRLQKQTDFLEANSDFGLIGSFIENINKSGKTIGNMWSFPAPVEEVPAILFFGNYFAQSSTMIRKSSLPTNGYDVNMPVAEDYDLWIRIAEKSKAWNLPEILVQIRQHGENSMTVLSRLYPQTMKKIYGQQLKKVGLSYSDGELDDHYLYCVGKYEATAEHAEWLKSWFSRINTANNKSRAYDRIIFTKALLGRWYLFCKKTNRRWWLLSNIFWKGVASLIKDLSYREKINLFYGLLKQSFRKFGKIKAR
jgi:glycosyltransferase involved in cell wall biosynthesis